jgi:hypothetical protein
VELTQQDYDDLSKKGIGMPEAQRLQKLKEKIQFEKQVQQNTLMYKTWEFLRWLVSKGKIEP